MRNKLIFLASKYPALRMVVKPAKQYRDNQGNPVKTEGKSIQFYQGKYETSDKEEIAFIEKYMEANQGDIVIVDPKQLEREKRIHEKAKQLIEQEDAELAKKGGDRHGKDLTPAAPAPGTYPASSDPLDTEEQIINAAEKYGLSFRRKELKNLDECRRVILKAAEQKINEQADSGNEPDLEDESEEE